MTSQISDETNDKFAAGTIGGLLMAAVAIPLAIPMSIPMELVSFLPALILMFNSSFIRESTASKMLAGSYTKRPKKAKGCHYGFISCSDCVPCKLRKIDSPEIDQVGKPPASQKP